LEQFLKQFSTIPHDFISDFFVIAKEEYTDNEIIINFDIVCKWLYILKKNLKVLLINNFEKNFDYTIKTFRKQQKDTKRTSIYDEILITPNCMKELCMISQSAKAKEVRKYFIEMEKLITRIKDSVYCINSTEKAKDFIAEKGFDKQFGARPLKRAIQKYVEDTLAEEIITSKISVGDELFMDIEEGAQELNVKIQKKEASNNL
jgi:phage anti-repressor protein